VAQHALAELALDRVALVPARRPPHKPLEQDPGVASRLEMCELLLADADGLGVCTLEAEREGPSYTVDTLKALHASYPRTELTLIVGADIATTLPSWREPAELLELAAVAVAARPGTDPSALTSSLSQLSPAARVRRLGSPFLDISSSLVRDRAARGAPIEVLVGEAVARFIYEHGLYGARARAAS
jgi:nicotinate-nucleotide adenylyltransferase